MHSFGVSSETSCIMRILQLIFFVIAWLLSSTRMIIQSFFLCFVRIPLWKFAAKTLLFKVKWYSCIFREVLEKS